MTEVTPPGDLEYSALSLLAPTFLEESEDLNVDKPLTCRVTAGWENERKGLVAAKGIEPTIPFSSPPEFKSDPGFWTPEHLLLAAVASCFVVTFRALAERARMDFGKLELSVEGKLGTLEERLAILQVVLQPALTVFQSQDVEPAYGLLERTEHGCLIARTLNCPVLMAPLVQTAAEVLTR